MRTPEEIYDRILRAGKTEGIYDAWKEYRRSVTDYLIRHAEPGSSLLILGAGRLGDLDLPALRAHFGSVTVADMDREAMEEGLAYWKQTEGDDLLVREVNLTGLTREHFIEWIRRILEGYESRLSEEEFAASLEQYLKTVYRETFHHDPGLGFCRYDHAVILGVHSQLNNTFAYLWLTLSDLLWAGERGGNEEDFHKEVVMDRIFRLITSQTQMLTDRVSKAVQNSAMEGVFVGLEVERIGVPGPVDGAAQAFAGYATMHIEGEAELTDPVDLIWDYDPEREKRYRMRLMLCL